MPRKKAIDADGNEVKPFYMTNRDVLDVYTETYKMMRHEELWCQRAMAVDRQGMPCEPLYADACRWCVTGAIYLHWHIMKDGRIPNNEVGSICGELHNTARLMILERGLKIPAVSQAALAPLALLNDFGNRDAVLVCLERTIRRQELDSPASHPV